MFLQVFDLETVEGSLMLESFSFFKKMCQITTLNFSEVQNSDLTQFLEDGAQTKNSLRLRNLYVLNAQ